MSPRPRATTLSDADLADVFRSTATATEAARVLGVCVETARFWRWQLTQRGHDCGVHPGGRPRKVEVPHA